MLRMINVVTDDERYLRMNKIVSELHLTKCMKTTIKNLSGGEKKRLALASTLLTDPSIIFIDEPTSGLDTYLAMYVMKRIRSMAIDQNKTIIIVIHQPTAAMYDLIDSVYVLVQGGRQAFFGSKDEAIEFFTTECHLSSLDGFIEQLAASVTETISHDDTLKQVVADQYTKSKYIKSLEAIVERQLQIMINNDLNNLLNINKSNNFLHQLKWLLWRSFLADTRNPVRTTFVIVRTLLLAVIQGLLYFHLCGSNNFIQNVNAINLAVVSITINTSAYMILSTMPSNNSTGIRENHRGMYSLFAYYLSTVLHDFPTFFIFPFLISTIIYWMSGMDNSWSHYILFIVISIISSNTGAALGQLFASFSSSSETAVMTAVPILQVLSVFSGFYLSLINIPSVLRAVQYISPYYYSYAALLNIEWKFVTPDKIARCDNSASSLSSTNTSSTMKSLFCKGVLEHVNFYGNNKSVIFTIMMLMILLIICHIFSFIIILCKANRSRLYDYWLNITKNHMTDYQRLP